MDILGPYSALKAAHHRERLEQIANGEQPNPVQVQLVISDFCPMRCHFCAYRLVGYTSNQNFGVLDGETGIINNNPNRMIPKEKVYEILDDCVEMDVRALQFSVAADERIVVIDPEGQWKTLAIAKWVDEHAFKQRPPSGQYESCHTSDLHWSALAIDDRGKIVRGLITAAYRHPTIEPLMRVVFSDGRSVHVTNSHSLNVIRGREIHRIPISALHPGDEVAGARWLPQRSKKPRRLRLPTALLESAATDVPDSVLMDGDLARLLGYYIAEGCETSRSVTFVFGNGPREDYYRGDVARLVKKIFGIEASIKGRRVYIHSIRIQRLLHEVCGGGGPNRSKQTPHVIWSVPEDVKLEYLRGLFSGDGNFRQNLCSKGYRRNALHLKTCSRGLAEETRMLLEGIRVRATITSGWSKERQCEGRTLSTSDYYSVNVYGADNLAKMQHVLDGLNARCSYKVQSPFSHPGLLSYQPHQEWRGQSYRLTIKKIETIPSTSTELVYDITVGDTHRFLTAGGVGCFNTGGGEPAAHPDHREIFTSTLDRGLDLAVVTNGAILRDGVADLYAQAQWVRISLDAGRVETYAMTRGVTPATFGKVLKHIELIAKAKQQAKSGLILGVGYVITRENYEEVIEAARLARAAGADNFRISAVFTTDNFEYHVPIYERARDLARETVDTFDNGTFRVFNLYGDRIGDLELGAPDYMICGYQHLNTYIGGDLSVYRCCNTAYNDQGFIGSLKEQSFKQLWSSQQKRDTFATFDARSCERCMFNQKNRVINYLAGLCDAPHVNYV